MTQPIQILKSVDELDAVTGASQNGPVLLFKHSVTCPISARAQEQFVGISGVPRYALVVQYADKVSGAVAEKFGVEHASPQLLIIEKGEVSHTLTHSQIKAEAIGEHLTSR
jgi:bacillithiol system protein YtxJ